MKRIIIRRGTFELASASLARPIVTIGRSPACDVVMRASGVKPVHFIMEWVGSGDFNPNSGHWSVFDISQSDDTTGEGVIIGEDPISFRGFSILCREDKLTTEWEGGGITDALDASATNFALKARAQQGYALEVVQGRADSGAIEEVVHLRPRRFFTQARPLRKIPQFKVHWNPDGADKSRDNAAEVIRVLTSEMPGALIYQRGEALPPNNVPDLLPNDLLEVRWKGLRFFLRLVPWKKPPEVKPDLFHDKLLVGLFLSAAAIGLCLIVLTRLRPSEDPVAKEPPPRIAKVEIQKFSEPPPSSEAVKTQAMASDEVKPVQQQQPVETPPVEQPVAKAEPTEVKPVEQPPQTAGVTQAKTEVAAAKPQVKPNPGPKRSGLNAVAPPKDVNSMGLLKALSKNSGGPKGPGIRADQIVKQGLINSAVSGDQGQVVLKSGAIGELGTGKQGSKRGDASSLAQASTTLGGSGKFDPKSTGPIAAVGGSSSRDYAAGSALGSGLGASRSSASGASLDATGGSGLQISGGLTRDIVREVISRYRSQIRNCYERALLVHADLGGRIVYRWSISAAGPVVSVEVTHTDVHFDKLEMCVRDVIRSMQFPAAANGQSTTVIYPFAFQSHKKS